MCENTKNTVGLGNTITNPKRFRGWCFTLNNYTEEEYENIKRELHKNTVMKFIVGKEVGASGTPHLQGYVYFKEGQAFPYVKKVIGERAHLEKAKGTPKQNKEYCGKDENYISKGFDENNVIDEKSDWNALVEQKLNERRNALLKQYETIEWRDWQKQILEIIDTKPDTRTIHWVYDLIGNSGKSFLTKYIYLTRKIIIADGKKDNIFNQVLMMVNGDKKNKILPEDPEVVLLDIPRSSEGYINYGVLEQLKNGLIYSGKYEGGICAFGALHVIVFANFMPDRSQFSDDRWNIIDLT